MDARFSLVTAAHDSGKLLVFLAQHVVHSTAATSWIALRTARSQDAASPGAAMPDRGVGVSVHARHVISILLVQTPSSPAFYADCSLLTKAASEVWFAVPLGIHNTTSDCRPVVLLAQRRWEQYVAPWD